MEFPSHEALLEELMLCQDENRKFRDRLTRIINWIRVIEAEGVKVPSELADDLDLSFQNAYLEKRTLQEQLELKIEKESCSDETDEDDTEEMNMASMFHPMQNEVNDSEQEFSECESEEGISEPYNSDQKPNEIKIVDIKTILSSNPSNSNSNTKKDLPPKTTEQPKNEPKFNCQDCEAEFTSVYALITHAMIHLTPNLIVSSTKANPDPTLKCSEEQSEAHSLAKEDSENDSELDKEIDGLSDLDEYIPTVGAPAQAQPDLSVSADSKSVSISSKQVIISSTLHEEHDITGPVSNNMDRCSIENQQFFNESELEKNDIARIEGERAGDKERGLKSLQLPTPTPVHSGSADQKIQDLDDDDAHFFTKPCRYCYGFHRRGACPVLESPLGRNHPLVKAFARENRKKLSLLSPEYESQLRARKLEKNRINRTNRAIRKAQAQTGDTFPLHPHSAMVLKNKTVKNDNDRKSGEVSNSSSSGDLSVRITSSAYTDSIGNHGHTNSNNKRIKSLNETISGAEPPEPKKYRVNNEKHGFPFLHPLHNKPQVLSGSGQSKSIGSILLDQERNTMFEENHEAQDSSVPLTHNNHSSASFANDSGPPISAQQATEPKSLLPTTSQTDSIQVAIPKPDDEKTRILSRPCNFCFGFHEFRVGACPILQDPNRHRSPAARAIIRTNRQKLADLMPEYIQERRKQQHRNYLANKKKRQLDPQPFLDEGSVGIEKHASTDDHTPKPALLPPTTGDVRVRRVVLQPRFNPRNRAFLSHPCPKCFNVHPWRPCPMQPFPFRMRFPFPHPPGFRVRHPW